MNADWERAEKGRSRMMRTLAREVHGDVLQRADDDPQEAADVKREGSKASDSNQTARKGCCRRGVSAWRDDGGRRSLICVCCRGRILAIWLVDAERHACVAGEDDVEHEQTAIGRRGLFAGGGPMLVAEIRARFL